MTQNVRQFYNVMGNTIEGGGKEMTQIVREYLRRLHPGFCTEFFHFPPNLITSQRFSVSCEKSLAGDDFLFFSISEQLSAQLARQKNGADFALQRNVSTPFHRRFYGDIFYL